MKFVLGETIPAGAHVVCLRTRRAGANRKTLQGKNIVNDANFEAGSLTLKRKSVLLLDKLFLEHIERASLATPDKGYPIDLSDIDWQTSYIEVEEGVALNTGNAFELTISFIAK